MIEDPARFASELRNLSVKKIRPKPGPARPGPVDISILDYLLIYRTKHNKVLRVLEMSTKNELLN